MLRQIIIPSGNILNLEDNASGLEKDGSFLDNKPQEQQDCGNKKVDNKEDIKVPAIKGKKIAIIIASVKLAVGKQLTASTNVTLVENR